MRISKETERKLIPICKRIKKRLEEMPMPIITWKIDEWREVDWLTQEKARKVYEKHHKRLVRLGYIRED